MVRVDKDPAGPRAPIKPSEEILVMLSNIKRFVRDESGLETVEWAIVGGLVVAVGAIVFTLIGGDVKTSLENMQTITANAAAQSS